MVYTPFIIGYNGAYIYIYIYIYIFYIHIYIYLGATTVFKLRGLFGVPYLYYQASARPNVEVAILADSCHLMLDSNHIRTPPLKPYLNP